MKGAADSQSALVIEKKVRKFIRRFYTIKIFQGIFSLLFYALGLVLFTFLIDWIFKLSIKEDRVLFLINSIFFVLASLYFVIVPLLRRAGFIRRMSYYEAGKRISDINSGISDRIINIIELNKEKVLDNELYEAAITQKSEKIKWFNFNQAVSLKKLRFTAFRTLLAISLMLLMIVIWPDFMRSGYNKVIKLDNGKSSGVSINFEILSDSLKVEAGKDFILKFKVDGNYTSEETGVYYGNRKYKSEREEGYFTFLFRGVNNPITFFLYSGGIMSESFSLDVVHKPEISNIRLTVFPPDYTGLERMENEGDGNIEIPAGSRVNWNIRTNYSDEIYFCFKDTTVIPVKGDIVTHEAIFNENQDYSLICRNNEGLRTEYFYRIISVKDLFPEMEIVERIDSVQSRIVFVEGNIQDDYGIGRLEMISEFGNKQEINPIEIPGGSLYHIFYYEILPDTNARSYFFRVWDNDKVSGPKYTDSRKISLKRRTKDEIAAENSKKADKVEKGMEESIVSVEKLEDKIMKFRMERLSGALKPWEVQERVKEINDMKDLLLNMIEGFQRENAEFTDNEQLVQDQEIAEKAKEIEELLKELIDDELKALLEEFAKLEKEYTEQNANELSEKLEINMEKLKEQIEMGLELLKKFELEKELKKGVQELKRIASDIESKPLTDSLTEKVLEDYMNWEKRFEEGLKESSVFREPLQLKDLAEERKNARDSVERLNEEKGENKKPAGKKAASRLQKLSQALNSMLEGEGEKEEVVDIEELRQIRNSLNEFSKVQEELNIRMGSVNMISPVAADLIRDQKNLESKFLKVRDSLRSLGFKKPMIAKLLGDEMFHVETSMKYIFESFGSGRMPTVRIEQNRIMNNANILVLKLDEIIKSTENQKGSGSGKNSFTDSKKKSKGEQKGSEEIRNTRNQQESLKQSLKGAIQQMKQGKSSKEGRKGLSQMLGEREMMRRAAERLAQGGMLGKDAKERLMQALEMMKEVEKDIVYNRMGDPTLEKDEWIRTRLLEAENAERERENENRRESKEFKGEFAPNELLLDQAPQPTKLYRQTLKYREVKLKQYYQEKYDQYIQSTKKR
jgi:hypothetical protein